MAVQPGLCRTSGLNPEYRFCCEVAHISMNFYIKYCPYQVFCSEYCKVPKFSDTRKLCCNLPKIQTKRPNLRVFNQEEANGIANTIANGIANSEDPDQTAPLGAV